MHFSTMGLMSLNLLSDLPRLDHLLSQIFNTLVHELLFAHLLELLGYAILLSALLSSLLAHYLAPLLC